MRGQSGLEYAVIIALFLVVLIPVVYLAWQGAQSSSQISQARTTADAISDAADAVYAQGPGARTTVIVYMPSGINPARTYLSGREVNINLYLPNGVNTDIFSLSRGNMTGTLPTGAGRHALDVEMLPSSVVLVSEATG